MPVGRWASLIAFAVALTPPLCAQGQSTQDLPATPQPQPTAGRKKPEPQKTATPPPEEPSEPGPYGPEGPSGTAQPPRSTPPAGSGTSSSTDDKIDISPPANDAKAHPNAVEDLNDTGEFHPFDPHHAAKDIEVGDFYFKQHNYLAAISRYREALLYKPNDAIATYSLALALEKSGGFKEAVKNYQAYLEILPYGPKAADAHKALQRLKAKGSVVSKSGDTAKAAKPAKR